MERSFIRSVVMQTVVPHTVELPESLSVVGRFSKRSTNDLSFSGVESGKPRMSFEWFKGALRFDAAEAIVFAEADPRKN